MSEDCLPEIPGSEGPGSSNINVDIGNISMGNVTVENDCTNPVGVEVCETVDVNIVGGGLEPETEQVTDFCECFIDVAADGTPTSFVRLFKKVFDTATDSVTVTALGDFTDDTYAAAYTVTGSSVPCSEFGQEATGLRARRTDFGPGSGSVMLGPGAVGVESLTIIAKTGVVTVNDGISTSVMHAGESNDWATNGTGPGFLQTPIPFIDPSNTGSGSLVWTELIV